MIYGIGTDIAAVARLSAVYERHGETAARRILADQEWNAFAAAADKARFLAKRFAAKEAFAKAVGTGLRGAVGMRSIALAHDAAGKPLFVCGGELADWLAAQNIARVHVSISDEADYVVAFAVAECG